MIFVKNSRGGREVNVINTLSKINLSKIGWEGEGSTSIWIMSMSLNILFVLFRLPLSIFVGVCVYVRICIRVNVERKKLVYPATNVPCNHSNEYN